jgi:predicted aspartyl protease
MGRVTIPVTVANNQDVQMARRSVLPPDKVVHFQLEGVVDTGSAHLVLPAEVADRLGLPKAGEATIRYADQRSVTRQMVEEVRLEMLGREGTFQAILEPDRTTALIGAIVLETLDYLVDCTNQRVYPRDPHRIIAEVE